MKKIFALMLCAVLVLCVFCACAPKSKDGSSETYIYTDNGDGTCCYYVNKNFRGNLPVALIIPATSGENALAVSVVDESALEGATVVESVQMPDSVVRIAYFAFKGCSNLSSVTLSGKLTSVELEAFRGVKISEMTLPEGLRELGGYVFADCKELKTLTIPSSVTRIGKGLVDGCDALEKVFFAGTEEQWNKIILASGNEKLLEKLVFSIEPAADRK